MDYDSRDEHRVIRDPIHGYVRVPEDLMPVIQTLQIQRLRNISQTANVRVPYPSLNGSRFEHALGTMHLAMLAWSAAWGNLVPEAGSNDDPDEARAKFMKAVYGDLIRHRDSLDEYTLRFVPAPDENEGTKRKARDTFYAEFSTIMRNIVGLVGLLHDVGHPPFSHLLEDIFFRHADTVIAPQIVERFKKYEEGVGEDQHPQFHEFASKLILDEMIAHERSAFRGVSIYLLQRVFGARKGHDWDSCIHGLIDSQFDVDRLDYIIRDGARAGTDFWTIDKDRLLESLELHDLGSSAWEIGLSTRAVSAVESLLFQRMQYYRWAIFHPKALIADTALKRAFDLLVGSWDQKTQGSLASQLDYVGDWSRSGPIGSPDSFSVDDARVMELLRAQRSRLAHLVPTVESLTFEVCMRIADESSSHYRAAWKDHGEFIRTLKRKSGILLQDQGQEQKLDVEDPDPRSEADLLLTAFEESYDLFLKKQLESGNRFDETLKAEEFIERELNNLHGQVNGVVGNWIVAERRGFAAIKGTYAMLWDRERRLKVPFQELSPVYEALTSSAQKRPTIWAFFVPKDSNSDLPSSEQISDIVLDYLIRF